MAGPVSKVETGSRTINRGLPPLHAPLLFAKATVLAAGLALLPVSAGAVTGECSFDMQQRMEAQRAAQKAAAKGPVQGRVACGSEHLDEILDRRAAREAAEESGGGGIPVNREKAPKADPKARPKKSPPFDDLREMKRQDDCRF